MSTQEERNFFAKTRNEFALSAENAIKEIHDKFANFHSIGSRRSNLINMMKRFKQIFYKNLTTV